MPTTKNRRERSLPKGLLAGLLGGIAGAAVVLLAEEIFPPSQAGDPASSAPSAGHEQAAAIPPGQQAFHWALGAAAGGLYGMATEVEPSLAAWRGAAFGLTLNRLTRESRLPRMGLAPLEDAQTKGVPSAQVSDTQTRISAWISHAAYGIATDSIRRVIRRIL